MKTPLFYKQKPIFGLDIGHSTVKVVQLGLNPHGQTIVLGYGSASFASAALKDGLVVDQEEVAKAIYGLLTNQLTGGLTTDRAVSSIPVSQTFTRIIHLPAESLHQLDDAVRLEVEQYVPLPVEDVYVDYEITSRDNTRRGEELELFMVAAPKLVVDSFVELFNSLNLEVDRLETSLMSSVRGVRHSLDNIESTKTDNQTNATLLIDLGARSSDLSIFDNAIRVTGTIHRGGDAITSAIAKELGITERQAHTLKSRHGVKASKYKTKITKACKPLVDELVRETAKMKRYYESRSANNSEISNLVVLGGGANLPGLPELLEAETGLATSVCDPWNNIAFEQLQEPHKLETTRYTTAVGLALAGIEVAPHD